MEVKSHTLHDQRWQDRPSARSVLLTVLGELVFPHPVPVPTRAFVAALQSLGVGEQATRQALARSVGAGWLVSERRGRESLWHLTEAARAILAAGTERIYGFGLSRSRWSGEWLLLHLQPPSSRTARRRLRRRLAWAGFGSLGAEVWISVAPDREAEARATLRDLDIAGPLAFRVVPGGAGENGLHELVGRAWDLEAIARRHELFLSEVRTLRPTSTRAELRALLTLVHRYRGLPFVDPDLPDELLPAGWIGRRTVARFHDLHRRFTEGAQGFWRAQLPSAAAAGQGSVERPTHGTDARGVAALRPSRASD